MAAAGAGKAAGAGPVPAAGKLSAFATGDFEPVTKELTVDNLVIHGTLPPDMAGRYVRNGPNAQFLPKPGQPFHWFDGDGMVHSVRIKDGKAAYMNRWVRTDRYVADKEAGDTVYNFGDMVAGIMDSMLDERVMKDGKLQGRMHTNVIFHGKKLLALEETDMPYEMALRTLETIGKYDFGGELTHVMCAHPKMDPVTKELFLFGHEINPMKAFASFSVVSGAGDLMSSMEIPLRGSRFMHDMAITEKYAVVFDLPAAFDFDRWQDGKSPWVHRGGELEAKFGVFPRYSRNPDDVRWFSAESCHIFHTANAHEEEDGNVVVLHCCRALSYTMEFNESFNEKFWLYPYEWRFDLRTGETSERQLCDIRCDFPLVSRTVVGRNQRFSYYTTYRARAGDGVPLYDGLVKFDHKLDRVTAHVKLASHLSCGEFSFVPRKGQVSEDDGYLVSFVTDARGRRTHLRVYNARTLSDTAEPVARVVMPQRVPVGFHGNWVDDTEETEKPPVPRSRL